MCQYLMVMKHYHSRNAPMPSGFDPGWATNLMTSAVRFTRVRKNGSECYGDFVLLNAFTK
jgi:hypothetical protein